MEISDLKGLSLADERHQREWMEYLSNFDSNGNFIEHKIVKNIRDRKQAEKENLETKSQKTEIKSTNIEAQTSATAPNSGKSFGF